MKSLRWVGTLVLAMSTAGSVCLGASVVEVLDNGRKLNVSVSDGKWRTGQVVCVVRDAKRIACGMLAEITGNRAVVSLDFRNQLPVAGDAVVGALEAKRYENANSRTPASAPAPTIQPSEHIRLRASGRDETLISGLGSWDMDQVSTGLTMETFVGSRVSYGVQFAVYDIFNKQPYVDGYGVSLHRTFRANRSFAGIFASVGLGAYMMKVGAAPQLSRLSIAAFGHVGWGMSLTHWLMANAFVGISYYTRPKHEGTTLGTFHTLRPTFGLSLGVPF